MGEIPQLTPHDARDNNEHFQDDDPYQDALRSIQEGFLHIVRRSPNTIYTQIYDSNPDNTGPHPFITTKTRGDVDSLNFTQMTLTFPSERTRRHPKTGVDLPIYSDFTVVENGPIKILEVNTDAERPREEFIEWIKERDDISDNLADIFANFIALYVDSNRHEAYGYPLIKTIPIPTIVFGDLRQAVRNEIAPAKNLQSIACDLDFTRSVKTQSGEKVNAFVAHYRMKSPVEHGPLRDATISTDDYDFTIMTDEAGQTAYTYIPGFNAYDGNPTSELTLDRANRVVKTLNDLKESKIPALD